MERKFDEELRELNQLLLKMAGFTEEAIYKSVEALTSRDALSANRVIMNDRQVDELELVIDEKALDLLALRQPMAIDLRFITTGMKINSELERIADLAVDVAQRVLELVPLPTLKPLIDIPRLSKLAQQMVKQSIDAFVNHDVQLARQVVLMDSQADSLRNKVQEELINEYMLKDGSTASRAVPLLLIARHLERICDHATNIAEDVIYMVEAKVVKHHPEKI